MATGSRPGAGARSVLVALLAAWWACVVAAWIWFNTRADRDPAFEQLWPPSHPEFFNLLYAGVGAILATVLAVRAARAYGTASLVGRAVLWLAAGLVAWGVGNLLWFHAGTCTDWPVLACTRAEELPYPSVADAFYLLFFPCVAVAQWHLGQLLAVTRRDVLRLWWIPVGIVALTAYFTAPVVEVGGVQLTRGWLFDSEYGTSQRVVSTLYLVGDAALMTMAAVLALRARHTSGGMLYGPLLLVAAALVAMYAGDMVFDQRASSGTIYNADGADGLYALCYGLMALAFLRFEQVRAALLARVRTDGADG